MKIENRSMNKDLQQGVMDGLYKSVYPNRGGVVETVEPASRASILPPQYGMTDYSKGIHPEGCACSYCF